MSRKSRRGLVVLFLVVLLLVVFFCSLKVFKITGGAVVTLNPNGGSNVSFAGGGLSNDATYSRKNYGSGNYGG